MNFENLSIALINTWPWRPNLLIHPKKLNNADGLLLCFRTINESDEIFLHFKNDII